MIHDGRYEPIPNCAIGADKVAENAETSKNVGICTGLSMDSEMIKEVIVRANRKTKMNPEQKGSCARSVGEQVELEKGHTVLQKLPAAE